MLKFFRNQKDSWLVKGILVLTALSFMSLFGIQGISEMRERNRPVITVAGKSISTQDFINEYNRQIETLRRISGGTFSASEEIKNGLLIRTLSNMASRAVMEEIVERMHLSVSDADVRDAIARMPQFSGADGKFDLSRYNEYLKNQVKSENAFVRDTFLDLQAAQLSKAVTDGAVVPSDIAKTMYRLAHEQRVADVFRINPAKLNVAEKPSDAELKELYDSMTEQLTLPEYRSLSVMKLSLSDAAKKITVTDEELQEAYNENKAEYINEEIRNVDQMLFIDEAEAKAADEALKSGKTFDEVAEKIAKQTPEQTKLGDVTPSSATSDWSDQVFAAKKGEIVGPVQTDFGWQILRVNSITPKKERSFAQVKKELTEKVRTARAYDAMIDLSVALDDRLGAGESLEDIAASENLKIVPYAAVDADGKDENGKKADLPAEVVSTAFIGEEHQTSPMIETETAFYVARVDSVREPAVQSFERAKEAVMKEWLKEKRKKAARALAKSIEERLEKGEKADRIAKTEGVSYEQRPDLTRNDVILPKNVLYALFSQKIGTPASASDNGWYIVARATKAVEADPEKDTLGLEEIREEMIQTVGDERLAAVLGAFGEEYGLTLHEDAVKNAFGLVTRSANESSDEE